MKRKAWRRGTRAGGGKRLKAKNYTQAERMYAQIEGMTYEQARGVAPRTAQAAMRGKKAAVSRSRLRDREPNFYRGPAKAKSKRRVTSAMRWF